MPCPLFEPVLPNKRPEHPDARIPLIEEYDGLCHATDQPSDVPADMRFRCCNHGYARQTCPRFPLHESRSSFRFDLAARAEGELKVLCIEESSHAPTAWQVMRYERSSGVINSDSNDPCQRAQARAFCQSFLRRYLS